VAVGKVIKGMEGTKREKGKKEKKKNFVYFKKNLNKCLLASLIGE